VDERCDVFEISGAMAGLRELRGQLRHQPFEGVDRLVEIAQREVGRRR